MVTETRTMKEFRNALIMDTICLCIPLFFNHLKLVEREGHFYKELNFNVPSVNSVAASDRALVEMLSLATRD